MEQPLVALCRKLHETNSVSGCDVGNVSLMARFG